jgi:hypothetical protein
MINNQVDIFNKFSTVPVHINIILYRYNYIDNLIISELRKNARINDYGISNTDSIFITSLEFKKIFYKKFSKEVQRIKNISIDELDRSATSIYFLDSIFKDFINLKAININISYDKNYTRVYSFKDAQKIYFSYSIEYGILDIPRFLNLEQIKYLPEFYKKTGIFEINEEYKVMKTSDLLDLLTEWEANNPDELEEYFFIVDIVYDLIRDKLEKDETTLLIKNDF